MTDTPPLLPCPFCGEEHKTYYHEDEDDYFVCCCTRCGAKGPQQSNNGMAAATWNMRAHWHAPTVSPEAPRLDGDDE